MPNIKHIGHFYLNIVKSKINTTYGRSFYIILSLKNNLLPLKMLYQLHLNQPILPLFQIPCSFHQTVPAVHCLYIKNISLATFSTHLPAKQKVDGEQP